MPQVVKVEFGHADRIACPVPELAEVRPAEAAAFRTDEYEAAGAGGGEALQVIGELGRDGQAGYGAGAAAGDGADVKFLAPGDEPALALGAVRVGPVAERDRGDGLVVVRQEMRDRPPLVEVRQVLANLSRPWGVDAPIRRCACVPTLVTPVRAMIFTVIARPIYQTLLA